MSFFGHTEEKSFLGIDFGTTYIKVVELVFKDNVPTISNYGSVEMAFTEGKNTFQFQSPEEKIHLHFEALLRRMKTKSTIACAALPSYTGLVNLIEFPSMNNQELAQAIHFEAPKYVPLSLEDVTLSWEVIHPAQTSGSKMEVLLVAALNKDIARYEEYISTSKLTLELLELEIFSLARTLVDDATKNWLIIDIGSRATNIVLVEKGSVIMNRNINTGGNEITNTLMNGFNVSWSRAEQLKKSSTNYFTQAAGNTLSFPAVEMIRYESGRLLEALRARPGGEIVAGVILSGGAAQMTGLAQHLAEKFQLPVTLADPWKKVRFDERLQPAIRRYGSSFSVALGLALGGLENSRRRS